MIRKILREIYQNISLRKFCGTVIRKIPREIKKYFSKELLWNGDQENPLIKKNISLRNFCGTMIRKILREIKI